MHLSPVADGRNGAPAPSSLSRLRRASAIVIAVLRVLAWLALVALMTALGRA